MPKRYTPEYRDEAVRYVLNSGESVANCAKKLGMNRNTLSGWVTAYHGKLKEDATSSRFPLSKEQG
jgi:transposase